MLNQQYIFTSTQINFKRIINLESLLMSLLFITIPLISFGVVVGGYVLISPVLFLFIWGITSVFINEKDNINNTYIDRLQYGETKLMKLYNAITFYLISLFFVMVLSMICLTFLFILYTPGGLFHSELFNPNNNMGILINDFWYGNFIYSIFIQFTLYYLFLNILHKFFKESKYFMITIIAIAMCSLIYQSMFHIPFKITNTYGVVLHKDWTRGSIISEFLTVLNPQTHIGNFQQLLLHQAAYHLTTEGNKIFMFHIIDQNILSLSNDIVWNATILVPIAYIILFAIVNILFTLRKR